VNAADAAPSEPHNGKHSAMGSNPITARADSKPHSDTATTRPNRLYQLHSFVKKKEKADYGNWETHNHD